MDKRSAPAPQLRPSREDDEESETSGAPSFLDFNDDWVAERLAEGVNNGSTPKACDI